MADTDNKIKPTAGPIRFGLVLGVLIQLTILIGFIVGFFQQARPAQPLQISLLSLPNAAEPEGQVISDWWIKDARIGMTDQIRQAKRILLSEPSAFKQISKIHQILHGFHSGLSVQDEERLAELIYQESLRYGYAPELIVSVIMTESSFSQRAYSRKGAIGLMQIKPGTGQEMAEINQISFHGAKALYDPNLNIKLGIQYLALLHQRFGDLKLALTAYNYGPTRIAGYMDRGENIPPGYTRKVLRRYEQLLQENPSDDSPTTDDRQS
ncbi:MAG TPA: lytic transglycosylase domain-containing protein [Nitrospiria bacterium]|nr:lytic transglycosylase domain-containing protein [Nitrospiria bacterium]